MPLDKAEIVSFAQILSNCFPRNPSWDDIPADEQQNYLKQSEALLRKYTCDNRVYPRIEREHVRKNIIPDMPEQWRQAIWAGTGEQGISSRTIFRFFAGDAAAEGFFLGGNPSHRNPPRDPSDFGRCYKLLTFFPQWECRISEMASLKDWKPFVDNWDTLTAFYEEEGAFNSAPKLYEFMKNLYNK